MKRLLAIVLLAVPAFCATVNVTLVSFARGAFSASISVAVDNITGVISSITITNAGPGPCSATLTDLSTGKTVAGAVAANTNKTVTLNKAQQIYTLTVPVTGGQASATTDVQTSCNW